MPAPPSFRKVNPADFPVFFLALTSDDAAAVDGQRICRDLPRAAHLDHQRRGAGAGVRPAEVRGARAGRPERARRARRRHQRGRAGGVAGERQPADRHALRQGPHVRRAGDRPAARRRGIPADHRHLPQRLADPPAGARRASSTACRTTRSRAWFKGKRGIVLAIQRQPGTNTIEVVDAIKKLLPTFRAEVPPAIDIEIAVRPLADHPRLGRRGEVHAATWRSRWW